ncbi:MAG TPA: TonB-dependent receptor [Holophagaceae bacterium]|jgi:iron complex outermembrane receptor protein|nr:TonB-dependent receptor [Holophagaceae bacterium]
MPVLVNPSCTSPLTVRFSGRLRGRAAGDLALLACLVAAPPALARQTPPQQPSPAALAEMSLEDLVNIQVTSVSKKPEKLADAPAAVFLITREDIRRSGATSVPEALRLAPNLEVAKVDAFTWAITARGFNSHNGNKLLVLIDGRTVYSPFFSGVWWDAQDVVLEDIDRIEVISGTGGTLWGSNAVNGVINIITRSSKETEGGLVKATAGKGPQGGAARYGFRLPGDGAFRVYAKATSDEDSALQNGAPALDGWHAAQAGFRGDWGGNGSTVTVQGDAYKNTLARTPLGPGIGEGGNLLGRWERTWSQDQAFQVQVYADRVERDLPGILTVRTDTLDVDIQDRFRLGSRNALVLGGGYRSMDNQIQNSAIVAVLPARQTLGLSNLFAQDTINLVQDRLDLVLGAKLEHNDFTGAEFLPNARLAWKPAEGNLVWAAISRAVRTPSPYDTELYEPGHAPYLIAGGPTFTSEVVRGYEAGYRLQTASGFSLSFSPFYNHYDHIRTLEPDPALPPFIPGLIPAFVFANGMEGDGWGAELWGEIPVRSWWRLKPAYSYLRQDLRLEPWSKDPQGVTAEGNDPRHRILLTSLMSPASWLELDFTLRHVSSLPNPQVPAYTTMDAHVGWKPLPGLEVAIIGQNLFQPQHWEFNPPRSGAAMARAALLRVTWAF